MEDSSSSSSSTSTASSPYEEVTVEEAVEAAGVGAVVPMEVASPPQGRDSKAERLSLKTVSDYYMFLKRGFHL